MKSFQVSFSLLAPELRTTAATIQIEKRKWKERSLTQRGKIISEGVFLFSLPWCSQNRDKVQVFWKGQSLPKSSTLMVGLLRGSGKFCQIFCGLLRKPELYECCKNIFQTHFHPHCAAAALLAEKFPLFDHTDDCARIAMHPKGLMRYTSSTENSRIQKFLCQQTDRSNWNSNTDCHRSSRA